MKYTSLHRQVATSVSHNGAIAKTVLLAPGEAEPVIQFAQATFPPGQIAPSHAHGDMAEVFFVESGWGEIVIEEQVHRLEPGVCVLVEPQERHEVRNTGTEPLVLTYFGVRSPAR
ncbi:cupin domain-containing protein [Spirulina major CS-329]|uniref:cupin domain-containing protein n=1 Tax=Spirulina TaxID=1154 RepID=UPI00232FA6E7|nr:MULTISPECIES: cupin domain-containing protein [Spirulina]MDB9495389.1 cupin domain-containing protein [Spirulina subsalsa CS-330]MDB9501934.1 cupin domain-containing protein [Spirulina major CS-329]